MAAVTFFVALLIVFFAARYVGALIGKQLFSVVSQRQETRRLRHVK